MQGVACVASVSNRVMARIERKQKKVEGGGGEHDTQSGKVLKGSDALNTSIKSNEQSKQQ